MGIILDYGPAIEAYISGLSLLEASKKHKVDRHTLSKKLTAQGIQIRPPHTYWTHSLNHNAFDVLTDEAAYWVGFLMADGCIYEYKNDAPRIRLELAHKDRAILERLKLFVSAEHQIRTRTINFASGNIGQYDLLEFGSWQIVDQLAFYGVVPQKTHREQIKHLEYNRHFWRGIVDGDGCLTWSTRYPAFQLVGSHKLMRQFCEYVLKAFDIHAIPRKYKMWTVCLYCRKACAVMQHLYSSHSISLDRKQARAEEFAAFYD